MRFPFLQVSSAVKFEKVINPREGLSEVKQTKLRLSLPVLGRKKYTMVHCLFLLIRLSAYAYWSAVSVKNRPGQLVMEIRELYLIL